MQSAVRGARAPVQAAEAAGTRVGEFLKGHGTGNDFILLPDPTGELELSDALVAALCDRRRGLGADGLIRLVPSELADDESAEGAPFFMDYRNADGSLAEMCGNGARVFVQALLELGWADESLVQISTRAGVRDVLVSPGGQISVVMGHPVVGEERVWVATDRLSAQPGQAIWMPNPHAVTWVADIGEVGRLLEPPLVTPGEVFPEGVNVEFAQQVGTDEISMRVHERGVGETLSCGTGACAVAVAAAVAEGRSRHAGYQVNVPGGQLRVEWHGSGVTLTGAAEIVAAGRISPQWWEEHDQSD
ncbi:MAG: diaminopimelate epimerase [Candidatus Nanopelagicales bacterium]